MIHGDVKPANLVLTRGGHIVLVDFGVSTRVRSSREWSRHARLHGPRAAHGSLRAARPTCTRSPPRRSRCSPGRRRPASQSTWDGIDPEQAAALETAIRAGLATDPARRPATPGEFVERLRAGWGSTLPTGVLTFCLTDIEGSTQAWERDPSSMARALVRHDQIIAETVESHGGRFLKSMGEGDSTVSVFSAAEQAVAATIDCQRPTRSRGVAGRPRDPRAHGAAHGRGRASRQRLLRADAQRRRAVRALADGNQIFLSGTTAALVADDDACRRDARRSGPAPTAVASRNACRCSRSRRRASTRRRRAASARTKACSRSTSTTAHGSSAVRPWCTTSSSACRTLASSRSSEAPAAASRRSSGPGSSPRSVTASS